ncbi:MAG: orotidine-5'-phosphate decarboxylase [Denitrovibrio sp.]|nr:MAG: orotidine-5'-phosphate decarboxylase [Denitrovibrio sp.]
MKPEIIVALDFDNVDAAKKIVKSAGDAVTWYKVGLELFVADGQKVIEFLKNENKKIFLDLKFHDIPNTVTKAVLTSLKYETDMVNMHTQGGPEMMKTTVEKIDEYCDKTGVPRPLLIGVTLLTSLDEAYLNIMKLGFATSRDYVLHLAGLAKASGLDGVVSSAQETPAIKSALGYDFITVTPGIRPASASVDDQKRVVTPKDAKDMGTDFIVVGRPITKAPDPKKAAMEIQEEMC